jgi:hypothetical protein
MALVRQVWGRNFFIHAFTLDQNPFAHFGYDVYHRPVLPRVLHRLSADQPIDVFVSSAHESIDVFVSWYTGKTDKAARWHPAIAILVSHSYRWQHLSIVSRSSPLLRAFRPIKKRLPILRTLNLELHPEAHLDIFQKAPKLSQLRLIGVSPNRIALPWEQLDIREGTTKCMLPYRFIRVDHCRPWNSKCIHSPFSRKLPSRHPSCFLISLD